MTDDRSTRGPCDAAAMSEPSTTPAARAASVLRALDRLAAEHADADRKLDAELDARRRAALRAHDEAVRAATEPAEAARLEVDRRSVEAPRAVVAEFEAARDAAEAAHQAATRSSDLKLRNEVDAARKARDDARWEAGTVAEAAVEGAKAQFEETVAALDEDEATLQAIADEADAWLAESRMRLIASVAPPAQEAGRIAAEQVRAVVVEADERLADLRKLRLPGLFRGIGPAWLIVLAALALVYPCWLLLGWPGGFVVAVLGGTSIAAGLSAWLYGVARRQVSAAETPLRAAHARATVMAARCRSQSAETRQADEAAALGRRDQDHKRADRQFQSAEAAARSRNEAERGAADEQRRAALGALESRRDAELARLADESARALADLIARRESALAEAHSRRDRALAAAESAAKTARATNESHAAEVTGRARAEIEALNGLAASLAPPWPELAGPGRRRTNEVPPALPFGAMRVDPAHLPGAVLDGAMPPGMPGPFDLPAFLDCPERLSMVIEADGEGRDRAVSLIQSLMIRVLTGLPAGKSRFTILDPVGLGRNFAAFMHLADHDEALVTSRIWTEPAHIERKLADVTEHMENVIQKYLRNEYPSIVAYNAAAGEVAEPFRFVVVADFPANFTDAAARRLVSIASGGPRCGVYVLAMVDRRRPLPTGVDLRDLTRHAAVLSWREGRLEWRHPDFARWPLTVEAPPDPATTTAIVQAAGAEARGAGRVEVPFEVIAPPAGQAWTADSRDGLEVPLGRSGATRLQRLRLGEGTSQHVLIAGKTGSGKSTLLHALIVNTALYYGPDQVELYLVDFKKGVEFKAYAVNRLPHARVIAVESEREFGLSVLQRLDAELRRRGDLFRAVGAQNVAGYRAAAPDAGPLPRILLIVDEFQEFFVEDDKVAQEAGLLLDRLVRQGRAFGIHVLLGSQTLAGAYTLARSTIGQMAVRIALQCSESDAHLILSEDNDAARLLGRPGEAIYNDANGRVEGNNFFQVVWLPDERREHHLRRLVELARDRAPGLPAPLVFEGNAPAEVAANPLLAAALADPAPGRLRSPLAWLGEAIAIKDPTAVPFRRQAGAHLLLVGQNEESATAILAAALVGLAAQVPTARFAVLDGLPDDSPRSGALARAAAALPAGAATSGGVLNLTSRLAAVAAEVERRRDAEAGDEPPIFLILHDLQRFRALRKAEDDYGFGRSEAAAGPADHMATILREGPLVGVHAIAWCDTVANFARFFDRQAQREFDHRVLFQMSAGDSSTLIDSPAASKLGLNRALYSCEAEGRLEKFRPYAAPSSTWLDEAARRLAARPAPDRLGGPDLDLDAEPAAPTPAGL